MASVLRVEHIVKKYPGVVAVNDVSFELGAGQVLAVLGENGAGKSTLSRMICGIEKQDEGTIYIDEQPVDFKNPLEAMAAGIHMVHQELAMVGEMSVAENIFFNRQPGNSIGAVAWRELYRETSKLLERFHLDIDPKTQVKRLSIGTQQLLEIIRATSMGGKLIILDEPTSSLADDQVEMMFDNVRRLKEEGYAFIYITHKMDEIFRIADRILVMRDGAYVGESAIEDITADQIVTMMVGREIKQLYGQDKEPRKISDDYMLEVKELTAADLYDKISFGVRKGEILGIAGLIGAGRSEMALGIIGAHDRAGQICLKGKEVKIKNTRDAIKNKIAYISEDRKNLGLYLDYSVLQNVSVMQLDTYSTKLGRVQSGRIKNWAVGQIERFGVVTPSVNQIVGNLSGGNQQKCLLAMWLGIDPEVLIIDEPTKGIDVGAKADIYQMLRDLAAEGKAIIMISSDLPEVLGISDRIVVMADGHISGEVKKEDFSEEAVMGFATEVSTMEDTIHE